MLHFSPTLSDIYSSNARILDVPAGSTLIPLDVTGMFGGSTGYFSITEYAGLSAADFAPDDDDLQITEAPPLYDVETITALPDPVVAGTALMLHFRLLDGTTGAPASLNGSVDLELVNAGGDPVGFAYALAPATLPLAAGVVNGSVIVTTAGSLAGVYLSVKDVTSVTGARLPRDTASAPTLGKSIVGIPPKTLPEYLNTAGGWHHPLRTVAPLVGSFGEWRSGGTDGSGRPHFGMDLAIGAGTGVNPVKRGVVAKRGELGGGLAKYMVVVHGDGSASTYMNIVNPLPEDTVVETNSVIARIADLGEPGPKGDHLHLELRSGFTPAPTAGAYRLFNLADLASRSQVYDPGIENAGFDIPLIQTRGNDVNAPEIKALYLWKADPKTAAFGAAGSGALLLQPAGVLVAQIVDREAGNLVPSHFDLAVEPPEAQILTVRDSFDYNTEASARRLFQDRANSYPNFGYVRRVGNVLPRPAMYQYWFKWDTTLYAAQRLGPRKVRLNVSDRAGHSTSRTFTFGPQLFPPITFAPGGTPDGSTFSLWVRNFMGPFPSGMTDAPQDTVRLTLVTAGLTSWEATFGGTGSRILTQDKIFTGHDAASDQSVLVRVRLKAGGPAPAGPQTLTIRAASGFFPDIAHEVTIRITAEACGTGPVDGAVGPAPAGFSLIPGGTFTMGDQTGVGHSLEKVHAAYVSAFFMGQTEVTYAQWQATYGWATTHGYSFWNTARGKAPNHPVQWVSWHDAVKWCNARSEQEGLAPCYYTNAARTPAFVYRTDQVNISNGMVCWSANGYRLPTEAEWEKAARGGQSGLNFPWGNSINHSQANYYSSTYPFESPKIQGFHPAYNDNIYPYTSPVGSFDPNGYGLYDMSGNVSEWCHDLLSIYPGSGFNNYTGPVSGSDRVYRGGSWYNSANDARVSYRFAGDPSNTYGTSGGFRLARGHL